ncbi:ABC transporter ATP-binding protein [Natronosporangium hydrolyticum]|nr:ABC transporter ATP-binding protein [Natronosporangium hydrolyticum]
MLQRRLLGLVRLAPLAAGTAVLASLAAIGCAVGQAVAVADVLRRLLTDGGVEDIHAPVLWAVAAGLARAALLWLRDIAFAYTAARVKTRMRDQLYGKVVALGPGWTAQRRAGDVQTTLADGVESLQAYVGYYLPQAAVALVAPAALVGVMIWIDPVVGLTVAVAAAVVPIARPLWRRLLGDRGTAFWRAYAAFGARVLEALQGMSTLKLHNAADRYEQTVRAEAEQVRHAAVGNLKASMGVYTLVTVAFGVGTALAVAVAALRFSYGALELAALLIVLVLAAECFRPLLELQNYWHQGFHGIAAASGMFAILDAEPRVRDGHRTLPVTQAPEVVFDQVSYAYPGAAEPAVREVSVTVAAGSTVGLVGRSGSGKTTLTSLLQRFDDPTSGAIRVDGVDLRELTLASARGLVSVVSQDVYLFHGSIADNLRLARPAASDDELVSAARDAHAHEFITELPAGYQTTVGERGARLSGGQRQRVAIARALLADAPILILDEATASVDAAAEALIQQALDRLRVGRTTIVIAHRLSTVAGADQLVVLQRGRVVEQGPPAELLARPGAFAELAAAQHGELTHSGEVAR